MGDLCQFQGRFLLGRLDKLGYGTGWVLGVLWGTVVVLGIICIYMGLMPSALGRNCIVYELFLWG